MLFSSHFLPALARPNVTLVTDPVTLTSHAVNGHEVDCLIYATGFRTTDFMLPMRITARGRALWPDSPSAHLGITVPGFPSLYLMYGPNTNTSGGSILVYLEAQAAYIAQALRARRRRGQAGGRGPLGPRPPTALQRHRLDGVRLVVPGHRRSHRRQLAGLHARVPGEHAHLRSRRVHRAVNDFPPSVPVAVVRVKRIEPAAACEPVTVSVPLDPRSVPETRTPRTHSTPCRVSVEPLPVT